MKANEKIYSTVLKLRNIPDGVTAEIEERTVYFRNWKTEQRARLRASKFFMKGGFLWTKVDIYNIQVDPCWKSNITLIEKFLSKVGY